MIKYSNVKQWHHFLLQNFFCFLFFLFVLMSTILLPLVFSNLSIVQHTGAIREAVRICVEKDIKLTISVRCDEIRKHQDKLDTIWSKIQQFLSALYVVQLTESYHQNRPLFPCDIIFEDVCGYPVYLEPTIEGVCILPQQQGKITKKKREMGTSC